MKKLKRRLSSLWIILQNYLRRGWQWFIGHTWAPFMFYTFNTWYNEYIYRKYCARADKLSQRLNWMRVYIFPNPDNKPGLRLVTSAMIAEENKHRSKKKKLDVNALLMHSYGWADKNASALENFYRGKPQMRFQRKADKIKKKSIELRKPPVNEYKRANNKKK